MQTHEAHKVHEHSLSGTARRRATWHGIGDMSVCLSACIGVWVSLSFVSAVSLCLPASQSLRIGASSGSLL
eukprot:4675497-Alexandrium_andersonii.AAC.1